MEIQLTQGYTAIIDEIDSDLAEKKWHSQIGKSNIVYAIHNIPLSNGKQTVELLHRVIFSRMLNRPLLRSELVDHENRNGLDCRRSNLRLATHFQNLGNMKKHKDNTSGYKGVSWQKDRKKWIAVIRINRQQIRLGFFDSPEKAYDAYCIAARKHFGEFWNDGKDKK